MLETTLTSTQVLTDAATGAQAILGNGSVLGLAVGITVAVGGAYMVFRFVMKAAGRIR